MNQKLIFILCFYLLIGCSTKKNVSLQSKPAVPPSHIDSTNIHLNSSDPFYPLKESIHDLQNQISDLKSQVVEYESRLHNPLVDTELIKLIKTPDLKNEIIMNTGTVIQGTIISENSNQMIVKTQIGQLTIEKEFITEIKEIEPLTPKIEFNGSIEETTKDNVHTYIGSVKNIGGRRADFVRIIYHFWSDDTSPIVSDSTFVSGNSTIYLNGVISDSSIESTEIATFELTTTISDTINVEYITKEVKWDIFE